MREFGVGEGDVDRLRDGWLYCRQQLGHTEKVGRVAAIEAALMKANRQPLKDVGRPEAGEEKAYNVRLNEYGNRASYLAARIKRDRPDIFARLESGEFSSVRAAAIEAGIVRVVSPVEQAVAALRRLDAESAELAIRLYRENLST